MYRVRRLWRHFKYRLLKLFFPESKLRKIIDIDRLDFEDATKLTLVSATKWIDEKENEFFFGKTGELYNLQYGLQYELARQMAEGLAKHVKVMKIYDLDREMYQCIGEIVIAERK